MSLAKKVHKRAPVITGERRHLPPSDKFELIDFVITQHILRILKDGRAYAATELQERIQDIAEDLWLPLNIDVALQYLCTERQIRVVRFRHSPGNSITYYALK